MLYSPEKTVSGSESISGDDTLNAQGLSSRRESGNVRRDLGSILEIVLDIDLVFWHLVVGY